MAKSAYLSRKLLNQLKTLESDSGDMLLTYLPLLQWGQAMQRFTRIGQLTQSL